ncbi:MAG TPA: hypothetical protein VFH59_10465 [Frateuria sp.]|uniref:hypothetical protein n=1 Tax=Frateuria sp. TaxID=2211372 RepID=UPI002D7E1709|nr:hypothetical protein [Frateuria sp.]HET6805849.1 hypothetical protein [Frateuria sp.]
MQQHKLPDETAPAGAGAWYRQPVLWLGAAILVASLAGCVWMIVLGSRHADLPLQTTRHPHTLLDMPMHGEETGADTKAGRAMAAPAPASSSGHRP